MPTRPHADRFTPNGAVQRLTYAAGYLLSWVWHGGIDILQEIRHTSEVVQCEEGPQSAE